MDPNELVRHMRQDHGFALAGLLPPSLESLESNHAADHERADESRDPPLTHSHT